MIPWWAYLYLAILGLLTFAGIIEELKKPSGHLYALGTFITFIIIGAFVTGVFITDIEKMLGYFSIPMLLLALYYDFVLSGKNLNMGTPNFGKPLDDAKSRMDLFTATLIVAPGYIAGLVIILRLI